MQSIITSIMNVNYIATAGVITLSDPKYDPISIVMNATESTIGLDAGDAS